jgi:PAS domain S-box-containing protein
MDLGEIYKLALKTAPDMIYIKDIEGKYIASSQSNLDCLGLKTEEEIIGKYDYELVDPKIAQKFLIQDKQVFKTGEIIRDLDWIDHKKLGHILVECIKSPIYDAAGNIIGIQGISRNMTYEIVKNLTKIHSKLQSFIENIPIAVWIKDSNNNYVTINRQYEQIFNIKKETIINQNVDKILTVNQIFNKETIELLDKQNEKVLKEQTTYKVIVEALNNKKYTVIKSPIVMENGKCIGSIGIIYEI